MNKNHKENKVDFQAALTQMGEKARLAAHRLALMDTAGKNACLNALAKAIENAAKDIKVANRKDLKAGTENGLSNAMLDRLTLSDDRIMGMANGLREVASLENPVGRRLSTSVRPNGLKIEKISVPIGVIGIVYESRPNVTVDAAGLCLKAGNSVILRGGSEAINSNMALAHCMARAGLCAGLPEGAVQLLPWTDREAVRTMLRKDQYIDVIIPRGGEGLIRAVAEQSTIPVIKHYKGICHVYVDSDCDLDMALDIVVNAKCQRPGVCNAIETLLIHRDVSADFTKRLANALLERSVELRGDSDFCALVPESKPANEEDWEEEYLDLTLSVGIVPSLESAVEHINKYGSGHSDSIVTNKVENADQFMNGVDSSTVYVNASTRFTDGGEFGMGAEIGISTDKLHARGPMGLEELTTYKYYVFGNGQVRT